MAQEELDFCKKHNTTIMGLFRFPIKPEPLKREDGSVIKENIMLLEHINIKVWEDGVKQVKQYLENSQNGLHRNIKFFLDSIQHRLSVLRETQELFKSDTIYTKIVLCESSKGE